MSAIVEADWSVEMAHDDPALEFPWSSDEPAVCYFDLKHHPELLAAVPEAAHHTPLRQFLAELNSTSSPFQTAKCDVWSEGFSEGTASFASYVDVLFVEGRLQVSFEAHESLVRQLTKRVGEPEATDRVEADAEFVLRRCFYHRNQQVEAETGCCMTCYVRGYGSTAEAAYANWSAALGFVCDALLALRLPGSF